MQYHHFPISDFPAVQTALTTALEIYKANQIWLCNKHLEAMFKASTIAQPERDFSIFISHWIFFFFLNNKWLEHAYTWKVIAAAKQFTARVDQASMKRISNVWGCICHTFNAAYSSKHSFNCASLYPCA